MDVWKDNTPFIYDLFISYKLDHPSHTVQWLPETKSTDDSRYSSHSFLLGTHVLKEDDEGEGEEEVDDD